MKLLNKPRPAAARPAQDSAQAAGAATHLRRGRGVAADRGEEDEVPGPRRPELRGAADNPGQRVQ